METANDSVSQKLKEKIAEFQGLRKENNELDISLRQTQDRLTHLDTVYAELKLENYAMELTLQGQAANKIRSYVKLG